MKDQLAYELARASDRTSESIVPRSDPAAFLAEACLPGNAANPPPTVRPVPEFGAFGLELTQDASVHEAMEAVMRDLRRSTQEHIGRAVHLILDIQDMLRTSMETIHTSQQLIQNSDRVIARARTLGSE
ncbi:hypothetical protein [Occallatibacter riparius]|uniref:Uncharacterized protein n=1 Tax=Occallatibacter riparius TaxID=1002689 RepID=A0A9J7BP63_9BACT|nr:hypothetical protein [Occallatibacter riparius]UWZ84531.1 hypothetical protein MOP44_01020 [Occallatibacter riparius]